MLECKHHVLYVIQERPLLLLPRATTTHCCSRAASVLEATSTNSRTKRLLTAAAAAAAAAAAVSQPTPEFRADAQHVPRKTIPSMAEPRIRKAAAATKTRKTKNTTGPEKRLASYNRRP